MLRMEELKKTLKTFKEVENTKENLEQFSKAIEDLVRKSIKVCPPEPKKLKVKEDTTVKPLKLLNQYLEKKSNLIFNLVNKFSKNIHF